MARMFRTLLAPAFAALMVVSGTVAQAAFTTGTQGFADLGTPTVDGGGSSLATATTFTFGTPLLTSTAETGSFAGSGSNGITVTATTLNLATPSTFTVGSTALGTFTASSITTLFSTPQSRAFTLLGTFVSGTNFGTPVTTAPASFTVSFTQVAAGGAISDSATLSIPPATVPEPASVAMLGLGLVGSIGFAARRRLARA